MKIKRNILGEYAGTAFGTIEFVLTEEELRQAHKEYLEIMGEHTTTVDAPVDWETRGIFGYAEKWWNDNGYDWVLKKEKRSHRIYTVTKDGNEMEYDITPDVVNFKKCMDLFQYAWNTNVEYNKLVGGKS